MDAGDRYRYRFVISAAVAEALEPRSSHATSPATRISARTGDVRRGGGIIAERPPLLLAYAAVMRVPMIIAVTVSTGLLAVAPTSAVATPPQAAAPEQGANTRPAVQDTAGSVAIDRRCLPKVPARGYAAPQQATTDGLSARRGLRTLRTWSYFGPRAELSGAQVKVRDRTGCVVATGRTARSGTFSVRFSRHQVPRLPLTVTAQGGRAAGVKFTGTMKARVFRLGQRTPVTQISLASTAATRLATQQRGYVRATAKVRRALGIAKGSLPDVLRYRNSDVGFRQLARKIRRTKHGFDGYAVRVARTAERGGRLRGLRPASAMQSGPLRRAAVQAAEAAETSVCQAPLPTTGSTSDQVISDIAAIGVGGLLEYAGVPVTSADGITGMLLSPIGEDSEATVLQSDVQAVLTELTCISEQINYLSAQIQVLQFTVDVDTATSCSSALTTSYNDYSYVVGDAQQYPLNAQNSTLLSYLPLWNELNETCGSAINDMLFGTAGGQASAWQQLNQNYSSGVEWYTQAEVQGLQTFLSYWGTLLYQQFILTNEYANFYGEWESAQANAGGSNPSGTSPLCASGAGPQTPTFCVWQNNIAAAYPDDLYSDEIGIISNGDAVNANPGGMVAPKPIFATTSQTEAVYLADTAADANESYTPTAMNGAWWWNYYLNYVQYSPSELSGSPPATFYPTGTISCGFPGYPQGCFPGGVPTSTQNWPVASATQFNNQGVNPNGYGSAVQTFWNPQATGRQAAVWSNISALADKGPGGVTAQQVFYDAINQTPSPYPSGYAAGGAWSGYSESNTTFWTNDTTGSATLQAAAVLSSFTASLALKAPLGSTSGYSLGNTDPPASPVFAFLTQRTWWPGAAGATSFEPPQPPTS